MAQHVPAYVNAAQLTGWGRGVATSLNLTITDVKGKQALNDNLTSLSGLSLTGSAGYAVVVNGAEDGFELSAAGGGGVTTNVLTINNGGAGAASGATFDGSAPITISYNTVGAAASGHDHAGTYEPADATLTALAGASWSAGTQVLTLTAADTVTLKTVGTASGNILDKAAGDSLYQPLDTDLSSLAGLSLSQGDILYRDGSALTRLAAGTAGQYLRTQGAGANPVWANATDYQAIKIYTGLANAADTINVNSTSYVDVGAMAFMIDLDEFLFTQFRLVFSAGSNQAGQTITAQMTYQFSPSSPIHTGGNDVVITNSFGTFNSGWISKDDAITTGLVAYSVALKGSNSTVDLAVNSAMIMLRK